MPPIRRLTLDVHQHETLVAMRDHHAKPYLRERAAALLKVAAGASGQQVAQHGLYKERQNETIYDWLNRYEAHGIGGLYIRVGRGRKASFSP